MSANSEKPLLDENADTNTNLLAFFKRFEEVNQSNEERATARHQEIKNQLSDLEEKYKLLSIQNKKLESKCEKMEYTIQKLTAGLSDVNQKFLASNVVIRGLPELEENPAELLSIIHSVLAAIGLNPAEINVKFVTRLGAQKVGSNRPILVQLNESEVQRKIIVANRAAKRQKKLLNCGDVFFKNKKVGPSTSAIYIDEHLTHYNSVIYAAARTLQKRGRVQFAWVDKGEILVREKEKAPVRRIMHEGHLMEFGVQQDESEYESAATDTTEPQLENVSKKKRKIKRRLELLPEVNRVLRQRTEKPTKSST